MKGNNGNNEKKTKIFYNLLGIVWRFFCFIMNKPYDKDIISDLFGP